VGGVNYYSGGLNAMLRTKLTKVLKSEKTQLAIGLIAIALMVTLGGGE
jgi:hypothetical protein